MRSETWSLQLATPAIATPSGPPLEPVDANEEDDCEDDKKDPGEPPAPGEPEEPNEEEDENEEEAKEDEFADDADEPDDIEEEPCGFPAMQSGDIFGLPFASTGRPGSSLRRAAGDNE